MSFTDTLVGLAKSAARYGRVERMLREIGWTVDERREKAIGLYFKCPLAGRRTVYVLDDGAAIWFFAYSTAVFESSLVPDDVSSFAMVHNSKLDSGRWELALNDDKAFFKLKYCAIADGVSAAWLKAVCEEMAEAASTFDKWLDKKGYR